MLSLRARALAPFFRCRPCFQARASSPTAGAIRHFTTEHDRLASDAPAGLTEDGLGGEKPAEPFRVLFCGSDVFSVATLEALLGAEDVWQSIAVVTPRERAIGRGGKDRYTPPLKLFALEHNIEHHDVPSTGLAFPTQFTRHHPSHLLLTASFGHIIPTPLLTPFAHSLNVHPSALPRYRGAAPVQWAIANGDTSTGVTVQSMAPREVGVDAGAILGAVEGLPIPHDATYDNLLPDLAHVAGRLLVAVLRQLQAGTLTPRPQDPTGITRAPKITHALAQVRWDVHSAGQLAARHRGFGHHQPLWAIFNGNGGKAGKARDPLVQLTAVRVPAGDIPVSVSSKADEAGSKPGTVVLDKPGKRVLALTKEGWLEVERIKAAGKKDVPAREWWNGLPKEARGRGWTVLE